MLNLVDTKSGTVFDTVEDDEVVLDVTREGAGDPLLLLHGVEGVAADALFIDRLAENFSVHAPSHPGFDLSPRPEWCDSVEDLAYLYLNWLRRQDKPVTVVGLQFGGWIAAEMAVREPQLFRHLVLVDSVGIRVSAPDVRDIADVFALPREDVEHRTFATEEARNGDLSTLDPLVVERIARNEEALALYGWDPYLHNPRLRRWLSRITAPTLILWGEQDGIVTPDYGRMFADALGKADLELISDAGHAAQVDQPDRVAELIRAFAV